MPVRTHFLAAAIVAVAAIGIATLSTTNSAQAATSDYLNFQARLFTPSGAVVPDGNYHIEFKIYDSASSGASSQGSCSLSSSGDDCWWMETRTTGNLVRVVNGYFSVQLGSVTAFGSSVPWDQRLWLTMNIGGTGGSPSWDGEMLSSGSRIQLTAVPYAFTAGRLQAESSGITNQLVFATPSSSNKTLTLPNETGTVCLQSSANCGFVLGSGTAFLQGGNTMGAPAVLGTNDSNSLSFETAGLTQASIAVGGAALFQNTTDSTAGFRVQDASGDAIFTVDTTNDEVEIGRSADTTGKLVFYNSASANTATIQIANQTASTVLTVPDAGDGSDIFCLQELANCGSAGVTLQQAYDSDADGGDSIIQLSTADDSLIFRNPSSGGTDSTYVLTIDQLATGAVGGLSIQSAGTGNLFHVRDTTATAVDVLTIADGGATTFRNQTDSTTAFQIQDASGDSIFTVDTTNDEVEIGRNNDTTGRIVFNSASGTGSITLTPANPGSTAYTLTLPAETGTLCSTGSVCAGYQASSTAIIQVPGTTAQNTITPTANSVVGLTVNGTSGTAATALNLIQGGAATALNITSSNTGTAEAISLTNTTGTQVAGLSIDRNGGGGTTTSLLSLSNTAGTATNGILFTGTIGTDIQTAAGRNLVIESGTTGGITIGGDSSSETIAIGGGAAAKTVTLGSTNTTSTLNLQSGSGLINLNTTQAQFTEVTGTRTFTVQTRTTNVAGTNMTISAGAAGAGGSAFQGGTLTLQGGGAAGTGNANGGNVSIAGGAGTGTGVVGSVVIGTPTFSTATQQNCSSNCNITQANIDSSAAVLLNATNPLLTITMGDPTITTAGKIVYVTAVNGSNDFTLQVNGGGAGNLITMRPNTTATMIWNGADWTAAGASSSTDLQSAYNNTLTSAGGAELILNPSGGNADGLTIRNNGTTPIIGAILEAQTSVGSNLFSVNNNATEYANNGGAESTTFTMWPTAPTGGSTATITRTTTAGNFATGQAAVQVATTGATTANQGVANTLSAALTANLTYNVSFTVRSTASFSTLDVMYSRDGTNSSLATCATGQTVPQSSFARINCSFTAPATAPTSSNAVFIRQSNSNSAARTYYVDNLSVTVNASVNYAADGSVDAALGSNWTDFDGGAGSTTMNRDTTVLYDTSASVSGATTNNANQGIRNNMAVNPEPNTQYLVTFYARSSTTFNDITVGFLPTGGTTPPTGSALCSDYNTQSVSTSAWTKITCLFTTAATTVTNADLVIYQPSAPGAGRTIWVDALSITLNTNTASNVQVGGGNEGGPTTLFTLDRSSSPPIAANNDSYLGSMYYDTVTGRIQCYEADGWGACGAAPDNIVNLNPEYAGAVLNGPGVGTMTADFCGNGAGLSINTSLCASGEARNFYQWTSPQASLQTYSIYISYQLPATFNGFASDDTVQLTARVDSTSNAEVTYEMFRSDGSTLTQCWDSVTDETDVIAGGGDTANVWHTYGVNGNEATGCGFTSSAAGDFIIFKINLSARSNANAYVSTLSFTTTGR